MDDGPNLHAELNRLEIEHIANFNSVEDGLNLTYGGASGKPSAETRLKMSLASQGNTKTKGRVLSEEHKARISKSNTGLKRSLEARANISKAHTGLKLTNEHKANIAKGNKGKKRSTSSINKWRESRKGFKHTEEAKLKISKAMAGRLKGANNHPSYSKPVEMYDLNLNLIATFPSCKEAWRITGIPNSSIGRVANGQRTQTRGYIFKYA